MYEQTYVGPDWFCDADGVYWDVDPVRRERWKREAGR